MDTINPRRWLALLSLGAILASAAYLAGPLRGDLPASGDDEGIEPGETWLGEASWYGPGLHGNLTASGERYDMHALTAAHRTLPLGTRLRLVNPETARSVVVEVNDRGPCVQGREIDVSYEAARRLGFRSEGVAVISIQVLEVPPRPRAEMQPGD